MGFLVYSSGAAWENAYGQAVRFLANPQGTLLLGPCIGGGGKKWIFSQAAASGLFFGNRVQDWKDWVEQRARQTILAHGSGFRAFHPAYRRVFYQDLIAKLAEAGALEQWKDLCEDPQFFRALLESVEEARLAGLYDPVQWERVQDKLKLAGESAEGLEEFFFLVLGAERAMEADGELRDFSLQLRAVEDSEEDLFLLGFEKFHLLEVDLLQRLSQKRKIHLPLAMEEEKIHSLLKGKSEGVSRSIQSLLQHAPGRVQVSPSDQSDHKAQSRYLLKAENPAHEARVVGFAAAQKMKEGKKVEVILPQDFSHWSELFKELGLEKSAQQVELITIAQDFLPLLLEWRAGDFSLIPSLELAKLFEICEGKFASIETKARARGIRQGLGEWKKKSKGDQELEEFAQLIDKIAQCFPLECDGLTLMQGMESCTKLLPLGEWARKTSLLANERNLHTGLGAGLRMLQLVAHSQARSRPLQYWLTEWKELLGRGKSEKPFDHAPLLQEYKYGEWIPPQQGVAHFCLGWDSKLRGEKIPSLFLSERIRGSLGDLVLSTSFENEFLFLNYHHKLTTFSELVFSRSAQTEEGQGLEDNWMQPLLSLVDAEWPALAPSLEKSFFSSEKRENLEWEGKKRFSPSFLEAYKACGFRAMASRLLYLEEGSKSLAIDISSLEEGSISHKALELFFGKYEGRSKGDPSQVRACVEEALSHADLSFYAGSEWLLEQQKNRLVAVLEKFLLRELEHLKEVPLLSQSLVEQEFQGQLGQYTWKGKIDRIDVDPVNKRFLVIDYKSGSKTPSTKEVEELKKFQLPLYLEGAKKILPGHEPIGAIYASLKSDQRNQGLLQEKFNRKKDNLDGYFEYRSSVKALMKEDRFEDLQKRAFEEALRLLALAETGAYFPEPEDPKECETCEFKSFCRIEESRALAPLKWERTLPDLVWIWKIPPPPIEGGSKAKGFNDQQQLALARQGQFTFVEASAGTGKTTVIVEKIRLFLEEQKAKGIPEEKVCENFAAISFTEKSAEELAIRLGRALLENSGLSVAARAKSQVSTIHGFCKKVMNEFPLEAKINPMAQVMDAKQSSLFLEETLVDFFLHPPASLLENLPALMARIPRGRIEKALRTFVEKRSLLRAELEAYLYDDIGTLVPPGQEKEVLQSTLYVVKNFLEIFEQKKRERFLLDFNDLETSALEALKSDRVRDYYRKKLDLVLVDEFQDTNLIQREILERISRDGWTNLFVVGDAKQSIYRFRAADVSVFQSLRKEAEKTGALVTLSKNYRSREELVKTGNLIFEKTFGLSPEEGYEAQHAEVEAFRKAGGYFKVHRYDAELAKEEGAKKVEAEILAKLVEAKLQAGWRPNQIAVLFRRMAGNEVYLRALTKQDISFELGSSRGFFAQPCIQDFLSGLRVFFGKGNEIALASFLRSPFMRVNLQTIANVKGEGKNLRDFALSFPMFKKWEEEAAHLRVSSFFQRLIAHYPFDSRSFLQWEKWRNQIASLEAAGLSRPQIVESLSTWSGWEDAYTKQDESTVAEVSHEGSVKVMTIHSSKGLEFPVVIMADLLSAPRAGNDLVRAIPGIGIGMKLEDEESEAYKSMGQQDVSRDLAEYKRLLYVAYTRAQEECHFILPHRERKEGKKSTSFADWIDDAKVEEVGVPAHPEKKDSQRGERKFLAELEKPKLDFRLELSISEMAAHHHCAEFHRLKFVQKWDDKIVSLWEKPKGMKRKQGSKHKEEADAILKRLGIENKERGVALHRALERIQGNDLGTAASTLRISYQENGLMEGGSDLDRLIELDLELLKKFLESKIGQELFSSTNDSHPEIPFRWKVGEHIVMGVMDRLVKTGDGRWIVADYKSSINEDNWERYRFQVACYGEAVRRHLVSQGEKEILVTGYLVNLHTAEAIEVTPFSSNDFIEKSIDGIKENYLLEGAALSLQERGIEGGTHCLTCPYAPHCEAGRKIVLA